MKKLAIIFFLMSVNFASAQAFIGKHDSKFQVGANLQEDATGLNLSYDYGLGPNFSIGLSGTYLLGIKESLEANFQDRIDIKARFNANLSSVLQIGENFDIYPGLSLGLKNFGFHTGARYFFNEGFGLYTELGLPIAKYDTNLTPAEKLHNRFYLNIGAAFNIE